MASWSMVLRNRNEGAPVLSQVVDKVTISPRDISFTQPATRIVQRSDHLGEILVGLRLVYRGVPTPVEQLRVQLALTLYKDD